jgi:hypothetical protein
MVKNQTGGNKAKQQGRKFRNGADAAAANAATQAVRKAQDATEVYAVVNRILGGRYCEVTDVTGTKRRCTIRKKFTRRRSVNNLAGGVWVLIGLYTWGGQTEGEILEIYTIAEKERLQQLEKRVDFKHLLAVGDQEREVDFHTNAGASALPQADDDADLEEESQDDADHDHDEADDSSSSEPEPPKPTAVSALKQNLDWINEDDI